MRFWGERGVGLGRFGSVFGWSRRGGRRGGFRGAVVVVLFFLRERSLWFFALSHQTFGGAVRVTSLGVSSVVLFKVGPNNLASVFFCGVPVTFLEVVSDALLISRNKQPPSVWGCPKKESPVHLGLSQTQERAKEGVPRKNCFKGNPFLDSFKGKGKPTVTLISEAGEPK